MVVRNKVWVSLGQGLLRPLAIGIILSSALHVLWLIFSRPVFFSIPKEEVLSSAPIEISEVPKEWLMPPKRPSQRKPEALPRLEKQIVETESANNNLIDPDAQYLSDKNQKAEKQTRASLVDKFQAQKGEGKTAAELSSPLQGEGATGLEGETPQTESEFGDKPRKDWKSLSLRDLGVAPGGDGGAASTDDRLEGVENGNATILSTREFRYFSYYHRIKELLRQYWKPTVERKLHKIWNNGRNLSEEEMVTRVLVLLDESGSIQRISRVSSSGFDELDEAAVEAFRRAGPFPNPPKGMVDTDGFIRIHWDFILRTESAPRIQFRSVGNTPP